MRVIATILFLNLLYLPSGFAQGNKKNVKKVVKFRTHTEFSFTGEAVQGKVRSPEVFYIFQRKKYGAHQVIGAVPNFDQHRGKTLDVIKESLK